MEKKLCRQGSQRRAGICRMCPNHEIILGGTNSRETRCNSRFPQREQCV